MSIEEILDEQRKIWGKKGQTPDHILASLLVTVGDIARQMRDLHEKGKLDKAELEKEFGNLITSTIRWCDDLAINPAKAVKVSLKAHEKYQQRASE